MEIQKNEIDFIAELKYLKPEEGGRSAPAHSKYRPQIKFEFEEMQTSGQQIFIDTEEVKPGEIVKAEIKMASPSLFFNRLTEDMTFEFREGSRIMGTGKILKIFNAELKNASR